MPYPEEVWKHLERLVEPLADPARQAWASQLALCDKAGLSPAEAADHLAPLVAGARGAFRAGMAAFESLGAAVDLCGDAIDGKVPPERFFDHMVRARAVMARLHDDLAGLADHAGVAGLAARDVTRAARAEAEEAVATWERQLAARRAPPTGD